MFMKRMFLFFYCLCLLSLHSFAQRPATVVSGVVVDSTGKEPLSGATVSILASNDSSVLTYVLTDDKGNFLIKDIAHNQYRLVVSFQGHQVHEKLFSLTDNKPTADLGKIILKRD